MNLKTTRAKGVAVASFAGAAALAVAGVAVANSLNTTSDSLGASSTTIAACQQSGTMNASYTTSDAGTGFKITKVTVSGVDATNCAGKTMTVAVTDGTTVLGSGTASVVAGTTSYDVTMNVSESAATHVDIEIK